MKKFKLIILILAVALFFLYKQGNGFVVSAVHSAGDAIQTVMNQVKTDPGFNGLVDKVEDGLVSFKEEVKGSKTEEKAASPSLSIPDEQTFSVYNIEIGDTISEVEKNAGKEQRATQNEYGVAWHAYHQSYQNFMMAAYDNRGKVVGLYTNQDLISSKLGIKLGSDKQAVTEKLGEPQEGMRKGLVMYEVQNNGE